jgi:fanconi anemia group J protein
MQVWDVEDIVDLGTSMSACPFFAAKQMEKKADLIFCPYNYLIDPAIRESMGISIEDSIIIFDEAHNVEDCAREAASCQFTLNDLADASRQLQLATSTEDIASLIKKPDPSSAKVAINDETPAPDEGGFTPGPATKDLAKLVSWFHPVAEVMLNLHRWLREASETSLVQQEFEKMGNTWGSDAVLSLLQNVNATCANIEYLKGCFKQGLAEYDLLFGPGEGKNPAGALFTGPCLKFIEAVIQVFDFILMDEMKFLGSYKLLIERTPRAPEFAVFSTQGAPSDGDSAWNTSVCFLCLHGAVGFRPLVKRARSIALVSGTLAPFDGLRAELGLDNVGTNKVPHVSLTTSHVLATDAQLSVTRLKSFGNMPLRVDFKNQERADFQDAIGSILLMLIGAIPDGVLVFLPSYAMLDKLSRRWKSTGLWNKLQAVKPIFVEPRASATSTAPPAEATPPDLQQVWNAFDKAINSKKGGIFFGVCRGKLSEGMDFQDEFARAVIVIGIPFAHVKSTSVILKKEYNSIKNKEDSRFLTGGAWYSQQAFRALNQSIGRVVRHRYDYGAIILLDERFCDRDSETQVSAWVRRALKPPLSINDAVNHLSAFFPRAAEASNDAKLKEAAVRSARPD